MSARAIWEQAIAAKGGRDRLHAIRNVVVTSRQEFRHSPRPDVATYEARERLAVLPDRLWEYDDYRPGLMGDFGMALDIALHRVLGMPKRGPAQGAYDDLVHSLAELQYVYLMETDGVRPVPVDVRADRVRRAIVDVLETRVGNARVDFWIDRERHLPARVTSFRQLRDGAPPSQRTYLLTGYAALEGIQMPATVRFADDRSDPIATTYRFDVEYDEAIFSPGSVRFEKNGWMKR